MNRRSFLRLLSLGATATGAGVVLPQVGPVRRFWQVPRGAPVPGRGVPGLHDDEWLFAGGDWSSGNSGWVSLRDAKVSAFSEPPLFALSHPPHPPYEFADEMLKRDTLAQAAFEQRVTDAWLGSSGELRDTFDRSPIDWRGFTRIMTGPRDS